MVQCKYKQGPGLLSDISCPTSSKYSRITVEETLDMSAYCDVEMPAAKYKLRAIVHHIGTSCDQGHYIADVTTADGKFWRCNDADVTQIAQLGGIQLGNSGRPRRECAMLVRNNVTKKTPYLVIYQKT